MRDGGAAGTAPGGPEFNDVNMVGVERLYRVALHPFGNLEFRGRVADRQFCFRRQCGDRKSDAGECGQGSQQ